MHKQLPTSTRAISCVYIKLSSWGGKFIELEAIILIDVSDLLTTVQRLQLGDYELSVPNAGRVGAALFGISAYCRFHMSTAVLIRQVCEHSHAR